jgi:hypothetical protein
VAALAITASASGLVRNRTIPLMTVEEVDQALAKTINYRASRELSIGPLRRRGFGRRLMDEALSRCHEHYPGLPWR